MCLCVEIIEINELIKQVSKKRKKLADVLWEPDYLNWSALCNITTYDSCRSVKTASALGSPSSALYSAEHNLEAGGRVVVMELQGTEQQRPTNVFVALQPDKVLTIYTYIVKTNICQLVLTVWKLFLSFLQRGIKSIKVIISRKLMATVIDVIALLPANIYYVNGASF